MKILLAALLVLMGGLILRIAQLQVWQRDDWSRQAVVSQEHTRYANTIRGSILDCQGRTIAEDRACLDACVDYRAIQEPPDEKWVRRIAQGRLRERPEALTRAERAKLLPDEIQAVRRDIDAMWALLATMPGATRASVAEAREAITQRVERRRRLPWYRAYEEAITAHPAADEAGGAATRPAWYRAFLLGDDPDEAPQLKAFQSVVDDELQSHPILKDISPETHNLLAKRLDRLPGLDLRAGIIRAYPFHDAGAHVLGHLSRVTPDDLGSDAAAGPGAGDDKLTQYLAGDTIGRLGLEALFEPQLRGRRGQTITHGSDEPEETPPTPGQNVRTSIDIALEGKIQQLFQHATIDIAEPGQTPIYRVFTMHGAAVVIDVPTGQVRALASYPAFDPNTLDADYPTLAEDEINLPLMNRATQDMLEPGSTVKPMVGISTVTQGLLTPTETIECTGYLVLGGHQYPVGRCWTMTRFHIGHHQTAHDPHPTGFLTLTDAIERSCNVFFENCGDRLGIGGLSYWMDKFGLGRPTGIGIAEASGLTPAQSPPGSSPIPPDQVKSTAWFGGIGQGRVAATPLQMANVAATIARDGVWIRPHLTDAPTSPADTVELHLNPAAVRAAREGMTKVVNSPAGSGTVLHRDDMLVAGKTGTAQAAPLTYRLRDADGNYLKSADGAITRSPLSLSTAANPNPQAPFYLGTGNKGEERAHAWFIGFAPADHPQIAFAVLVEYGGSGGSTAAPIAKQILQACIDAGYLRPDRAGGK